MVVRRFPPLPLLLLAVLAAVGGCASTGAPKDWLPEATEATRDPYGAWIAAEFPGPQQDLLLEGEFLAVDRDSLYVLSGYVPLDDPIVSVPLVLVEKAKIAHFDPQMARVNGWVLAGSLSTLSHGLGAGITLPLWVIMGSALAGGHSRTPLENYPNLTWEELRVYARFPQGPPPGMRKLGLHPRRPLLEDTETAPESYDEFN